MDSLLPEDLSSLRAEINELDERLLNLMAERMQLSVRVANYKKSHGLPAVQQDRMKEIYETRRAWAAARGLSDEFARRLFQLIHDESVNVQEQHLTSGS
jgi:chorismate mutase